MSEYKIVSGICRPQTYEALYLVKSIQREVNRFLDSMNKPLIYVGGRIGKDTIKGVNLALNGGYQTCTEVGDKARSILSVLKQQANARNLAVVADPESLWKKPSTFDSDKNEVVNPTPLSAGVAGVPYWLLAAVGAGYYLYGTSSGKKAVKRLKGKF